MIDDSSSEGPVVSAVGAEGRREKTGRDGGGLNPRRVRFSMFVVLPSIFLAQGAAVPAGRYLQFSNLEVRPQAQNFEPSFGSSG